MKNLAVLVLSLLVLTGCFGGGSQKIDERGVEAGEVIVENVDDQSENADEVSGDEDTKDNDSLGETAGDTDSQSSVDIQPASPEEKQAEEEVLNEFENDLEDIFSDLGV